MVTRRRTRAGKTVARLERRLSLVHWVTREFGCDSARALRDETRGARDGFDSSTGRSFVALRLLSRRDRPRIPADDLARYDDNIRAHLGSMNAGRPGPPIRLRYFQHLAALAAEHYLRRRSESRAALLASLNEAVLDRRDRGGQHLPHIEDFTDADLDKLAFWMATGSGKTLLLHLNYRQFLHYNNELLDNILLVTPNEGLSAQHLQEAELSGVPMHRFDAPMTSDDLNPVRVIEITKLVQEKRGGGITVPVESFEGNNLVFVDEGHKGSGGDAWRAVREALSKTGFTFEYSATFGQALAAAKDEALTAEYGKAVIFDYSYRWFYEDGFGKDFRVMNLDREVSGDAVDALLVGGLLSFYEQRVLFDAGGHEQYRLASPLWVFVGGTVNAVYSDAGKDRSDVLTVCRFFHRFLHDRDWAVATMDSVLNGRIGATFGVEADPFAHLFHYLRRSASREVHGLYEDILNRVFHAPASGGLQVRAIRSGNGEIGLRAAGADAYFGVVYVGDSPRFMKLTQAENPDLVAAEDIASDSLFDAINDRSSTVNVLVGAKRFMEGWNSWRVSGMGLLNLGRSEGSQIIQLFGRGVRLRGKDFSLKRSRALAASGHPPHLHLLETLNVFAIRASYMAKFREYLKAEGVGEQVEITLPFQIRKDLLGSELLVPRVEEDDLLGGSADPFALTLEETGAHRLDIAGRVSGFQSGDEDIAASTGATRGVPSRIPEESLHFLDWERAHLDLVEHIRTRGFRNVVVGESDLRGIASQCELAAEPGILVPRNFADLERLQEAVMALLRKSLDFAHRRRGERAETSRLRYRPLDITDANLSAGGDDESGGGSYRIRVPAEDGKFIEELQTFVGSADSLGDPERAGLLRRRRVSFDRHLYEPLLVAENDGWTASPPALVESERRFVEHLREFWRQQGTATYAGVELFLLRNLTRGAGIGFFGSCGFYPDFILWLKAGGRQHIVFVEPHGMLHADAYQHDEKARLHERLRRDIGPAVGLRSGTTGVTLDSYIISATPFDALRRRYGDGNWTEDRFATKHILFFPEADSADRWPYLKHIFDEQLGRGTTPTSQGATN